MCVGKQHHNSPLQIKAHVWIVSRTKPQRWAFDGLAWRCVKLNNYHGKHCTEAVSYCPRTEVGLTLSGPRRSVKWSSFHQQKHGNKSVESIIQTVHSSASKIRCSITKISIKKQQCVHQSFSSHLSISPKSCPNLVEMIQLGIKPDKSLVQGYFLSIAGAVRSYFGQCTLQEGVGAMRKGSTS